MNRLSLLSMSLLVTLGVASLTGCTATFVFPETGSPATQISMGGIQGSNYGGHAPIVGAHVYLLQATASSTGTGYGQLATSLLNSTPVGNTSGGSATSLDSAGGVTNGMYYVTTNAQGYFNISSEYTCTQGLPVYLYAPGGTSAQEPSTPLSTGTVSAASATFTANNLFSVGQYVTFAGLAGTGGATLNLFGNAVAGSGVNNNTPSYLVTQASLTSFTVTGVGNFNSLQQGTANGGVALPTLPNNPAIANMAVLGICSTSTNFSSLSYIYLNEVSTVATAYALGGFFTNTSTGLVSTDAVHLSIPAEAGFSGITAGSSPAWVGIENAANNAALLYDIQGNGQVSSSGDGEGHVASITTGNGGTVSQAMIDGLANALAACVDSGNTATTASTSCTTLLADALPSTTSGAPSGTAPKDTGTAAINLAHNPWTNQTANIYNLIGSLYPYSPTLASAPNDFAVAITYPLNTAGADVRGSVAIDAGGNAWVAQYDASTLTKLSPAGANLGSYAFPTDSQGKSQPPGDVAIDSGGRAWVAIRNQDGTVCPGTSNACLTTTKSNDAYVGGYLFTPAVVPVSGSPFAQVNAAAAYDQLLTNNLTVAVDGNDNAYFANHLFSDALVLNSSGAVVKSFGNPVNTGTDSTYSGPFGVALDQTGNLWMTSNIGAFDNPIANVTYWNTAATTTTQTSTFKGTITNPEGLALDASNNVWVADAGSNNVYKIPSGSTTTQTAFSGGGVTDPVKVVVDGSGLVFASSPAGGAGSRGNLAVFSNTGAALSGSGGVTGTFVTGTTTTRPMRSPYFLAVDNTGDVWVATNSGVTEYIGIATPVLTPLSAAVKKGTIAARP